MKAIDFLYFTIYLRRRLKIGNSLPFGFIFPSWLPPWVFKLLLFFSGWMLDILECPFILLCIAALKMDQVI